MLGTASARAIARLLTVCAVLTGLFLMHGLPAQGCAAGIGMPATAMPAAATTGHSEHPAPAALAHDDQAVAAPAAAEHGIPCVFTPAPRGLGGLSALLLAATVALVSFARPTFGGDRYSRSRRAPPRTGSELLTTLCVSRT